MTVNRLSADIEFTASALFLIFLRVLGTLSGGGRSSSFSPRRNRFCNNSFPVRHFAAWAFDG